MQAASVNIVYTLVKDVCSAHNRGMFSPSEFNSYAHQAQLEVFSEILGQYDVELRKRQRNISNSGGAFDSTENIQDLLRPLLRYNVALTGSGNTMNLPSDYAYVIPSGIQVGGVTAAIVSPDRASYAINSFLAPPSESSPICVIKGSEVVFYPATLTSGDDLSISYYKYPQGTSPITGAASTSNPTWAYNTVSNVAIYNATTSVNFELPKVLEHRLAMKILMYVGVEIREPEITQFVMAKEAKEQSDKN